MRTIGLEPDKINDNGTFERKIRYASLAFEAGGFSQIEITVIRICAG